MKHLIHCLAAVMLFASCERSQKISYENTADTTTVADNPLKDTTKIFVVDLPVKFDSTDILIFGVEQMDLHEGYGISKTKFGSYKDSNIPSGYLNMDNLTGNFINLVFQNPAGEDRKLTDKKIIIKNVSFLRQIFRKTKKGYLLYSVTDSDTNGDSKLDYTDLEALYISNVDGSGFRKISKELHEFDGFNIIDGLNKIYFRTSEHTNNEGQLNNSCKFHYFYIDFSSDNYTIVEHNPLKVFE
jgi:hypothetical protein